MNDAHSEISARVVEAARRWIGTPYRHQSSAMGLGADCLGLVRGVWRDLYGVEPEQPPPYQRHAATFERTALLDATRRYFSSCDGQPQPGRLLLFQIRHDQPVRHCAICTEPGAMVHAIERRGVREEAMSKFWMNRLHSVFQFPFEI